MKPDSSSHAALRHAVEHAAHYLPAYAGNLDIMTAASARTAEMFAEELLKQTEL